MTDLLKILLLPLFGAAGWWAAARTSFAGLLNVLAATALLALWLLEAVAGFFAGTAGLHVLLARGALIGVWIAAPLALGIFLQEAVETGDRPSTLGALAALLTLPAALVTAATGYLGPMHTGTPLHPLRFAVLHLFLTPGLTGILLVAWLLCALRASRGT